MTREMWLQQFLGAYQAFGLMHDSNTDYSEAANEAAPSLNSIDPTLDCPIETAKAAWDEDRADQPAAVA